jgi:hypothetical protein
MRLRRKLDRQSARNNGFAVTTVAERSWGGPTLIAVIVVGACWSGALLFWRGAPRAPSGLDMGQLLLALPAAILLAVWLAKKSFAAPTTATAASAAASSVAPVAAAVAAPVMLSIIHAALRMPHGESVQALAAAIADNTARCELDNELLDGEDFPVASGRIADIDAGAQEEAMRPWLALHGMAGLAFSEAQWRALALASSLSAELAQQAAQHPLLADFQDSKEDVRANQPLPMLRTRALLSLDAWSPAQCDAVQQWLMHLVAEQGWPKERLQMAPPVDANPTLLQHLEADNGFSGLTLIVACHSRLDQASVTRMQSNNQLFTPQNQRGQVPAEGAAGLLLGNPQQAALFDAAALTLKGASAGVRPESADTGKVSHALLQTLVHQALDSSQTDAASLGMVCADTDARPIRAVELMSVTSSVLPELDMNTEVARLGASCGDTGAAAQIAALVLAAHMSVELSAPVLWVSNQDPLWRAALVVRAG